jgi:hypothetical protein
VRKLIFDNVQNHLQQRDARIGRENVLNIGISATYIEIEGIDRVHFDDKRRRLKENRQKDVNVDQMLGMIDKKHIKTIATCRTPMVHRKWVYSSRFVPMNKIMSKMHSQTKTYRGLLVLPIEKIENN